MTVKTCDHPRVNFAERNLTNTKSLINDYSADMYKRFRKLKGLIRTTIVDNDALELTHGLRLQQAEPERSFGIVDPSMKADNFEGWLEDIEGQVILEEGWQDTYVNSAYISGLAWSAVRLSNASIIESADMVTRPSMAMRQPLHSDAISLIRNRNFTELRGVTQAMNQQIKRELINGMTQGENPRIIAKAINDRVDKIGITRARTIARTETIRAHQEAALNRYRTQGVKMIEWVFGGGPCPSNVCPDNAANSPYKIDNVPAHPAHPNGTCALVPYIEGQEVEQRFRM